MRVGALLIALLFVPVHASAATLYFSPGRLELEAGVESAITLYADAEAPVHAAEADISYDPAVLRIVSVSTDGSLLTNFSTKPEVAGSLIRFSGWMQQTFQGIRGVLVKIRVMPLTPGTTTVEMKSGTLLSADVQENNVATGLASATIVVSPHRVVSPVVAAPVASPVTSTSTATTTEPQAPTSTPEVTELPPSTESAPAASQAASAGFFASMAVWDYLILALIIFSSVALGAFVGYLFFRAGQVNG